MFINLTFEQIPVMYIIEYMKHLLRKGGGLAQ